MSVATTVPFRGETVRVHEVGSGPTLGYLHGMVGNPGVHPALEALGGTGNTVVAPNLPGFNDSAPCEDIRTMIDWVGAVSEVVDLAGMTGAPVVAGSVGAMLALELASVRPEAFSQLVLIAPMGLWDDANPVADPFATTLSNQRRLLTADPTVTAALFDDDPALDADAQVDAGLFRYLTRRTSASLVWPIPEFGLKYRIHRVACPVTLIWGSADQVVPPSYAAMFEALLPNVVGSHVIDGAGHLAEWDRPDEVAALVASALG